MVHFGRAEEGPDAALGQDELGTFGSDARALTEAFFDDLVPCLGGKPQSSGLVHLQQLAQDVLNGDAAATLQGPVMILPSLPGSSTSSGASSSPKLRKSFKRKASEDSATKSPAKKRRSTGKGKKAAHAPAEDFCDLLELSSKVPSPGSQSNPSRSGKGGRSRQETVVPSVPLVG